MASIRRKLDALQAAPVLGCSEQFRCHAVALQVGKPGAAQRIPVAAIAHSLRPPGFYHLLCTAFEKYLERPVGLE